MEVQANNRIECNPDLFNIDGQQTTRVDTTIAQTCQNDVESVPDTDKTKRVNGETHEVKVPKTESPRPPSVPTLPKPPPVSKTHNAGKYRLLRTIGKGNFAKVKLAIHMATGVEVAIKIINKTVMDNTLLERLKREITIMKMTNHPNIGRSAILVMLPVKLLEIIENEDVLCLVMEYASGGEIFDYLVANGKMREKEARIKFRQLLSAMQYCHSKRIVHRDLKAENILLDQNLNVKVADFGLANIFDYGQRLTTFCGSPPYAAPELFLGIPYFGPGVDIWSLGVILFTLVLGHLPFDARDLCELRNKIISLHYTIPKGTISPECEGLLRKMLTLDPKDRSSLKALMQDKWVNFGYAPNEVLRPFKEPLKLQLDEVRVKAMEAMGFTQSDLESSVIHPEFDHIYATYHLLPETPSEFSHMCEDMNQMSQTFHGPVSLPQSLVNEQHSPANDAKPTTSEQPTGTAIGRFTVAPSQKSTEPPELQPRMSHVSNTSRTGHTNDSAKQSLISTDNREHHSLTSALPVAFKRAFLQMGRTLAGGTTVSSSPPDARTCVQPVRLSKSSSKHTDGRNVITAAPVPMCSLKKPMPNSVQTQKRPSPVHPVNTPVSSRRSDSTDSGSSIATNSRHITPTTKVESQTQRPSPSQSTTCPSKPIPDRGRDSITSHSHSSKDATDTPSRMKTTPAPTRSKESPTAISQTQKQETTQSPADVTLEESARRLVLRVWHDVNAREGAATNEVVVPKEEPILNENLTIGIPRPDTEVHSIKSEPVKLPETKVDIRRSLTNVSEQTSSELEPWPSDNTHKLNAVQPQIKVSHTVQGPAAQALRNEALRIQSSGISTPEPQSSNTFTLDANHQSTWSRGVFRALGGLFVQPKSPDVRPDASRATHALSKPREVRFPWSVHTTSTKSADEVLSSIILALEATPGCRYSPDPHLPYLLQCSWEADREALRPSATTSSVSEAPRPTGLMSGDPVYWEMEVCQLPRLHLRGVRLKRIRGQAILFRSIADLVMKSLHL